MILDKLTFHLAKAHLQAINLWKECQKRLDGRIEWVCEHGVGHTIWAPKSMGESRYMHGCDGCCSHFEKEAKK